ncbi:MAG: glycosyltransferase [Actinobacteria bacterium]|nr:glycosyltransferase [Actinomycetota bacterium]
MPDGLTRRLRGDGPLAEALRTARRGAAKAEALARYRSLAVAMDLVVASVPRHPKRSHPTPPRSAPMTIAAFSTYPLHTRRGGGQLRGWYLTEALGRLVGGRPEGGLVEVVSLTTDPNAAGTHRLGDHVVEHCVLIDEAQAQREASLRLMALDVSITDIAAGLMWNGIAGFTERAIEVLDRSRVAIAIQPYLIDAIRTLADGIPIVYDSHNDEVALKATILPGSHAGARWLSAWVDNFERRATEHASLVTATTETDLAGLARRARLTAPAEVVGNGVDTDDVEFVTGTERTTRRQMLDPRFGLTPQRPVALFVGSGHLPNIEAGRAIVEIARGVPGVDFLLAGDHSTRLGVAHLPDNVRALGPVNEDVLELLLTASTLALNPMGAGSGSNLKLFTYLAAGLPVVSTPVGSRGIDIDEAGIIAVPLDRFAEGIHTALDPHEAADRAQAGRRYVELHCDWRVLGDRFASLVADVAEGRLPMTINTTTPATAVRRTVFVEVTNTLAVNYITGFQRHTREMLGRLMRSDGPVRYVPVVWCTECATFRHLSEGELEAFRHFVARSEPPRSRLAQLADPLPDPLKSAGRALIRTKPARAARDELARRRRIKGHPAAHAALRIDAWPEDSWLFDLEAAWHNTPHRQDLLPWLHARGVRTAVLVADVMPYLFHDWFDAGQIRLFTGFMDAHLRYSEKFIVISECSRSDLLKVASDRGITRELDTPLITMGANFTRAAEGLDRPAEAPEGRYILSVATVEPRKNHDLLIRAFDALRDEIADLSVVFVGKAGWMTDDLQARMRSHRDHGGRLRWLDKVDDDLLNALFRNAYLAVQPAFYEGYGTPVIEALGNGVPTLSSNGGSLPEAGGEYAEYFDPTDLNALVDLIRRHYTDTAHHETMRSALADYTPPTWEQGANGIARAFSVD